MAVNLDIRPVKEGDVEQLVAKMRQADVNELRALGIENFVERIQASVDASTLCQSAVVDKGLGCIFGVVPLRDGVGVPWMLGTDLVTRHQSVLMRECRPYIQDMLHAYPYLYNHVHSENHAAKRWLNRVGFVLQPAAPYGALGSLFNRFHMGAAHV